MKKVVLNKVMLAGKKLLIKYPCGQGYLFGPLEYVVKTEIEI
jgi:hypothetical protein